MLFLLVNVIFVAYDVARFGDNVDTMKSILLIRFLIIIPGAVAVLV